MSQVSCHYYILRQTQQLSGESRSQVKNQPPPGPVSDSQCRPRIVGLCVDGVRRVGYNHVENQGLPAS